MTRSACVFLALALVTSPVTAQESPWEWENETELSFVSTSGNASASTLGLRSALTGSGGSNTLKLDVGGIRARSAVTTRTATGTLSSFQVNEVTTSTLTAESYFARGRYDRPWGVAFAFAGAGWERNTFAGIQNRVALVGGFGRTWFEGDSGRLKTDLGATYTIQRDVEPVPGADEGFGGIRATIDASRRVSASAELTSTLIVDENLEARSDVRGDWVNSLAVAISEGLALKTSVQLLYDSEPAFVRVPLMDGAGAPTGQDVLAPGEKMDSVVTLTLVIKL